MAIVGNQNRGPELLAIIWVFTILALLVVITRFYTKIKVLHKTGLDDALVVFSMVSQRPTMIWDPRWN